MRPVCKKCMHLLRLGKTPDAVAREKETRKKWLEDNAEKVAKRQKTYYAENKELCLARVKASKAKKKQRYAEYQTSWRLENSEKLRELARAHRKAHPEIYREYKTRRRLIETQATPKWANLEAIREIYAFASAVPGVHVDHIVPLNSKIVCGLHCEANLQLLPAHANMSKGNRFWPDMP